MRIFPTPTRDVVQVQFLDWGGLRMQHAPLKELLVEESFISRLNKSSNISNNDTNSTNVNKINSSVNLVTDNASVVSTGVNDTLDDFIAVTWKNPCARLPS